MRIKIVLLCTGAVALAGSLLIASSASDASTIHADLGITGATVAGYATSQADQLLPVSFTMTNHGGSVTNVGFIFTVSHASVALDGFVCPDIATRSNIGTDGVICEPGNLGVGKSTRAAVVVMPTIAYGTVTVRACARSLSSTPDPVPSNNCKTVSIPIR